MEIFGPKRTACLWENRRNGGSIYELSMTVWFISHVNYVITSELQKYIRNKFKSRSSSSSHATSTWNKMVTHMWMDGKASVKHSMFFKRRSCIHDRQVVFLCPSADVCNYSCQSPNHANHEDLSLLQCYAVLMGK